MRTILILTQNDDVSTTKVMRWIHYLDKNIKVIRLHPEDLYNASLGTVPLNNSLHISTEFSEFSTNSIGVVWTRKWNIYPTSSDKIFVDGTISKQEEIVIKSNLRDEFSAFFRFFIYTLNHNKHTYWLNHPNNIGTRKLEDLLLAEQVGFNIPKSFICTEFDAHLVRTNQSYISKHLSNCFSLYRNHIPYITYTCRVKQDDKESFFVSLIQEEMRKELEIRVFYINSQCFSIAIMSQNNKKTELDYRNYDYENPNREEVFALPIHIQNKIRKFMKIRKLETGSLDFILTPEGKYVFLEVNPCGQYDLFNLANIYPDKIIAEHLINKSYESKK